MSDLFASQTFVTFDDQPDIVAGYREAPPVADSFMPWVTILEPRRGTGELRWEFGPDQVLLPVRVGTAAEAVPPKGRLLRRRRKGSVTRLP